MEYNRVLTIKKIAAVLLFALLPFAGGTLYAAVGCENKGNTTYCVSPYTTSGSSAQNSNPAFSPDWTQVSSDEYKVGGGQYLQFLVEKGTIYKWSTEGVEDAFSGMYYTKCNNDSQCPNKLACQNGNCELPFNTELTLFGNQCGPGGSNVLAFSRDGSYYNQAELEWKAEFTGLVTLLVTNYEYRVIVNQDGSQDSTYVSCQATSGNKTTTVKWQRSTQEHCTECDEASKYAYNATVQLVAETDNDGDPVYDESGNLVYVESNYTYNPKTIPGDGSADAPYWNVIQAPTAQSTATFNHYDNWIKPGSYIIFSVEEGQIYRWSTCTSEVYDTQLSLFKGKGKTGDCGDFLAYGDDSLVSYKHEGDDSTNYCPEGTKQSVLEWHANFTGEVTLLFNEYNCYQCAKRDMGSHWAHCYETGENNEHQTVIYPMPLEWQRYDCLCQDSSVSAVASIADTCGMDDEGEENTCSSPWTHNDEFAGSENLKYGEYMAFSLRRGSKYIFTTTDQSAVITIKKRSEGCRGTTLAQGTGRLAYFADAKATSAADKDPNHYPDEILVLVTKADCRIPGSSSSESTRLSYSFYSDPVSSDAAARFTRSSVGGKSKFVDNSPNGLTFIDTQKWAKTWQEAMEVCSDSSLGGGSSSGIVQCPPAECPPGTSVPTALAGEPDTNVWCAKGLQGQECAKPDCTVYSNSLEYKNSGDNKGKCYFSGTSCDPTRDAELSDKICKTYKNGKCIGYYLKPDHYKLCKTSEAKCVTKDGKCGSDAHSSDFMVGVTLGCPSGFGPVSGLMGCYKEMANSYYTQDLECTDEGGEHFANCDKDAENANQNPQTATCPSGTTYVSDLDACQNSSSAFTYITPIHVSNGQVTDPSKCTNKPIAGSAGQCKCGVDLNVIGSTGTARVNCPEPTCPSGYVYQREAGTTAIGKCYKACSDGYTLVDGTDGRAHCYKCNSGYELEALEDGGGLNGWICSKCVSSTYVKHDGKCYGKSSYNSGYVCDTANGWLQDPNNSNRCRKVSGYVKCPAGNLQCDINHPECDLSKPNGDDDGGFECYRNYCGRDFRTDENLRICTDKEVTLDGETYNLSNYEAVTIDVEGGTRKRICEVELPTGTCGKPLGSWVLPNINQLYSIVDFDLHDPATAMPFVEGDYVRAELNKGCDPDIDPANDKFGDKQCGLNGAQGDGHWICMDKQCERNNWYWSSTTVVNGDEDDGEFVWSVNMKDGRSYRAPKGCVEEENDDDEVSDDDETPDDDTAGTSCAGVTFSSRPHRVLCVKGSYYAGLFDAGLPAKEHVFSGWVCNKSSEETKLTVYFDIVDSSGVNQEGKNVVNMLEANSETIGTLPGTSRQVLIYGPTEIKPTGTTGKALSIYNNCASIGQAPDSVAPHAFEIALDGSSGHTALASTIMSIGSLTKCTEEQITANNTSDCVVPPFFVTAYAANPDVPTAIAFEISPVHQPFVFENVCGDGYETYDGNFLETCEEKDFNRECAYGEGTCPFCPEDTCVMEQHPNPQCGDGTIQSAYCENGVISEGHTGAGLTCEYYAFDNQEGGENCDCGDGHNDTMYLYENGVVKCDGTHKVTTTLCPVYGQDCEICVSCGKIAGNKRFCGDGEVQHETCVYTSEPNIGETILNCTIMAGAAEECDNKGTDGNICTPDCKRPRCGDGIQQNDEVCDDGELNGEYGKCNDKCSDWVRCGDKVWDPEHEACDLGDGHNGNTIKFSDFIAAGNADCAPTLGGISYPVNRAQFTKYKQCVKRYSDYLKANPGCNADCSAAASSYCGDGIQQTGEACDDGLPVNADGEFDTSLTEEDKYNGHRYGDKHCALDCQRYTCGDGVIDDYDEAIEDYSDMGIGKIDEDGKVTLYVYGANEKCDDGTKNGKYGHCAVGCQGKTQCGNNTTEDIDTAQGLREECDKGRDNKSIENAYDATKNTACVVEDKEICGGEYANWGDTVCCKFGRYCGDGNVDNGDGVGDADVRQDWRHKAGEEGTWIASGVTVEEEHHELAAKFTKTTDNTATAELQVKLPGEDVSVNGSHRYYLEYDFKVKNPDPAENAVVIESAVNMYDADNNEKTPNPNDIDHRAFYRESTLDQNGYNVWAHVRSAQVRDFSADGSSTLFVNGTKYVKILFRFKGSTGTQFLVKALKFYAVETQKSNEGKYGFPMLGVDSSKEMCDPGDGHFETDSTRYMTDCNSSCRWINFCGDGIVQRSGDNDCDSSGKFNGYECKDGVSGAAEVCDKGENNAPNVYNGCEPGCLELGPRCGDNIVNVFSCSDPEDKRCFVPTSLTKAEQCDGNLCLADPDSCQPNNDSRLSSNDGTFAVFDNLNNYHVCRTDCLWARCGDGIKDEGEECDCGVEGSATRTSASTGYQTDPENNEVYLCHSDNGSEEYYNTNKKVDRSVVCRANCKVSRCGDGMLDKDEKCDDGNLNDNDSCIGCQLAACGDGYFSDTRSYLCEELRMIKCVDNSQEGCNNTVDTVKKLRDKGVIDCVDESGHTNSCSEFVNMSTPETDDDNNPLYDEEGNPKYNDEKLVNMFKAGYLHCCYDRKLEGGLAAADNNCLFVVGGTAEEPIYSTPADKGFSKDQFEGCDNSAPKTVGKCEEYVGITTSDPKTEEACNIKYASGTKENKECIAKVNKYDKCVADIEKNTYCNATCSDVIGRCGDGKVDRRPDGTPIEACDKYYIDAPFDHAGQYQHLDGTWQSSAVSEGHEDYTLATLGKYCTGDWVGADTAKSPDKPMCGNGITTDCWSEGCTVKWHSTGGNDADYSKKGDGYVDKYAGEECDMGVYTASGRKCGGEAYAYYCNANCKKNTGAECGDGIVQAASAPNYHADEFCDTVTDITAFNTCMDKCDTALHGDDTVDPAIQPIQGYAVENCRKACAYPGYCDNCQDSYGYCGDGEIHGPGYSFESGIYTYGGGAAGPEDCDLEATEVYKVKYEEEGVEKWKCPEGATKVGSDNDFECYTFIGDARSVSLAKTGLFTDFGEICDGCKKPKTGDVDGKCGDNKRSPRFESCDCAENTTFPCQFNGRECKDGCKMDSIGHIDKANSIGITGWACDPDHPLAGAKESNFIKLTFTYVDTQETVQTAGTKYVTVTKPAANNVILECGGGDTHGWTSDFTGITFASNVSVYTVKAEAYDFDIQSYVLIGEMTFSKKKSCGDSVVTPCEGIEVILKDATEDSLWDLTKKCCDEGKTCPDAENSVVVKGECATYGLVHGEVCVDEVCDDGKTYDNDGNPYLDDCNPTCTAWTKCGDNILQPDATGIRDDHTSYEECDSNSHETASCKGKFPGISNDNLSGNVRCYDHDEAVPDARKCKWEKKQWDEDNKDSGCKLTSNCNELSSIVDTWSGLEQLKEADEEVAAAQLGYLTGLPTGKSVTITVPESETAGLDAGDYTVPSEEVTDDVIAFLAKYEWDKEVAAENPYSEENIFDAATVNTEQVYSAEDASTYIKYKHSSDLSDNKKYYRTWVEADNPADDTWSEETPGLNPAYTEDRTPIQVADLETTKCYFECIDDLGWDGSKCVGRTDNTPCNECPDNNGIWNGGASNGKPCKIVEGETGYPQPLERHSRIVHGNLVWDKNIVASYSTTETDGCFYKCKEGTQWSGSQCNVEQQTVKCSGLPPHAKWIKVVKKYTTSGGQTTWQRVISVYTGEGDMEITQKLQSDNATYAPAEGDLAPLWVEHTHKNTDEDWQYNWREIDFKDLSPQNGYPSGGKPQGTAADPLMATDTPTRCYFQCDEGYYYDLDEKKCKEGSSSSCGDGMIQAEHCENLDPQDFKKCAFTLGGTEVCDDGGTPTTYNGTYGKDTNTGKSHCDKYCGDYNICKNAHPTDYEVWCSFMLEPGYTGRIETSTSKPNGEYFCGDNVVQHLPEDECYDTTCKPVIAANYPGANTSEFATSEQCDSSDNSNRKHLCDIHLTSKGKNTASSYYETGSISCSNTCKISTSGTPCGYCGDGVFQSVDASNNPLEECENTSAGIQYSGATEPFNKKSKTWTYNTSTGTQTPLTIPITGVYKITVTGGNGGNGAGGEGNTSNGGSGAVGGKISAQYYLQKGKSLTLYVGAKGEDGGRPTAGSGGALGGAGGGTGEHIDSFFCGSNYGGGGGGGGGSSYVMISTQKLLHVRGGGGGGGGEASGTLGSGDEGENASGSTGGTRGYGDRSCGGDGGDGGSGGRYDNNTDNYHYDTTTLNNGYKFISGSYSGDNSKETTDIANGSITIELVKYAPCKTDTCTFDETNLVAVNTSTVPCTGLPANAVWSSNSTTSKTINQTLNSSGNWTPSTTGSYNTSTAANYCYYKCKDGYFWNSTDKTCVKTRVVACPTINTVPTDSNWEWNIVSEIVQNYNGSTWTPADTVYSPAQRPDPTTSECRFKCKEGYTYQENDYTYTQGGTTTTVEGNHCKNERIVNCEGLKAHATWWGETEKHGEAAPHTITQHWTQANGWQNTTTGSYSASAIAGECRFHCNKGYTWSDSANECVANKRTTVNCNTKPGNTDWNDGGKNGKFEQTWSDTGLGSETCNATQWANNDCWFPRSRGATYQPTTAAECGYKCSADFHTENSGSTCISDHMDPNDPSSECNTGSVDRCKCENLPTGGIANTATRIARNWENHGGTWQWWPRNSYVGNYSETASTTECKYKCWSDATHHFEWDSNSQACVGQDIDEKCTGLPAHASWYGETEHHGTSDDHTITQTWTLESGTWKWWPVKEGAYSESNPNKPNECWFHCNKNYTWDSSSKKCVANKRTEVDCGYSKPAHSTWNDGGKNGKFEQTWNELASADCSASQWANNDCWFPRSKNSNHNATAGECIYKCNTNYTWNNSQSSSACNANKNTYTCTGKPDGTDWNMGSASSSHSYEQTWDEDHAGCNPSVTDPANTNSCWYPKATSATYNETANATECRYKCDANNTRWNNACVHERNISCDAATLPANTVWSKSGTTSQTIKQTWTPTVPAENGWSPSLTGTHNTATTADQCYYKCEGETLSVPHFNWNNGTCVANTKNGTCTNLPANAQWWSATITQTWTNTSGSSWDWRPVTDSPNYSASSDTSACYYKCYSSSRTYDYDTDNRRCKYCGDQQKSNGETCDTGITNYACYKDESWDDCGTVNGRKFYQRTCANGCGSYSSTLGSVISSCTISNRDSTTCSGYIVTGKCP